MLFSTILHSAHSNSEAQGTNSLISGFPHIIQQEDGNMATPNMPVKEGVYGLGQFPRSWGVLR
jgi:hypothetical protein